MPLGQITLWAWHGSCLVNGLERSLRRKREWIMETIVAGALTAFWVLMVLWVLLRRKPTA
jgi:hypothetical protein